MANIGTLYVIAAPSGAGKTTLVKSLTEALSDITVSISHTTRKKRSEEIHGVNYYFVDKTEFNRLVDKGEFLM
jgi:guanylate kinase